MYKYATHNFARLFALQHKSPAVILNVELPVIQYTKFSMRCSNRLNNANCPRAYRRGVDLLIIGIDPGFAITGFGVVEYMENRFSVQDFGAITTKASVPFQERLLMLEKGLNEVIERYRPEEIAVEKLFFSRNAKTALDAAHGRGIAVLAAARSGALFSEYTPLQVKQAVTGYGRATKEQVQQMVKVLLGLKSIPKPDDAADALAVAICCAHSRGYPG